MASSDAAARLMAAAGTRVDLEVVQMLAYRIYELAQHKDREDAGLFNALGTEWAALSAAAAQVGGIATQGDLDLDLDSL
jgi:putative DNA methylase